MRPDPAPARWAWCPICRAPAEIMEEWPHGSTSGTVVHVKVWCFANKEHRYDMPLEGVIEIP